MGSKILIVSFFLAAFIVSIFAMPLLQYAKSAAVEQPALGLSSAEMTAVSDAWYSSFATTQAEEGKIFIEKLTDNETVIDECLSLECREAFLERIYFDFIENGQVDFDAAKRNLSEAEAFYGTILAHIVSSWTISLIESITLIAGQPVVTTIDQDTAKVLLLTYKMSIAAVETSWLSSLAATQKEKCDYFYQNISAIGRAKTCGKEMMNITDKLADIILKDVNYSAQLETKDCAHYNILNIAEGWRMALQEKLKKTKIPMLKVTRGIDVKVLEVCNKKLAENLENITYCIKPRSTSLATKALGQTISAAAIFTSCTSSEIASLKEKLASTKESMLAKYAINAIWR